MPTTIDPSSSRPVVLKPDKDGKTRIRNKKTGEVLVLHGYGSMEGKLKLRKGVDLTKPIYEQVLRLEARARRRSSKGKSSTNRAHKKA
jgi:hypothetical protein